jgi:hypothetical protein
LKEFADESVITSGEESIYRELYLGNRDGLQLLTSGKGQRGAISLLRWVRIA